MICQYNLQELWLPVQIIDQILYQNTCDTKRKNCQIPGDSLRPGPLTTDRYDSVNNHNGQPAYKHETYHLPSVLSPKCDNKHKRHQNDCRHCNIYIERANYENTDRQYCSKKGSKDHTNIFLFPIQIAKYLCEG